MTPDWSPLTTELDRWRADGLTLPLWWRDDDAIAPTSALDRLIDMSTRLDLPVHLAIIPAHAEPSLAQVVNDAPHLIPVTHGWSHHSHAPATEKKAEFGAHRPLEHVVNDARQGRAQMRALFGADAGHMFVPPWNRIAPTVMCALPALGFAALSTFTPRTKASPAPGLTQINTHLDPINWKSGKTLIDPSTLIEQITHQLADRRRGDADATEPYGILTHHLVHDADIWSFTEQLLTHLLAGPTRCWTINDLNKDSHP